MIRGNDPFDEIGQANERIGRWIVAIIAAGAVAAVLFWWASDARAQDIEPHAWIMDDDRYKTDAGTGCCGPEHCRPAAPGDLIRQSDGSVLHVPTGTSLPVGSKAIYLTADPQRRPFACIVGGVLKCAALAGEG